MSKRKHGKFRFQVSKAEGKLSFQDDSADEIASILFAEVLPLTDQLISELVLKGYELAELESFKADGIGYCPERESFMSLEWQFTPPDD